MGGWTTLCFWFLFMFCCHWHRQRGGRSCDLINVYTNILSFSYLLLQTSATAIIISAALLAMLWALVQFILVSRIPVRSEGISDSTGLVSGSNDEATTRRLIEIYTAIYEGAESFLRAEYTICAWFILIFGGIIFVLVSWGTGWDFARGTFSTLSFVLGACTSIREYCSLQLFVINLGWCFLTKFMCVYFLLVFNIFTSLVQFPVTLV